MPCGKGGQVPHAGMRGKAMGWEPLAPNSALGSEIPTTGKNRRDLKQNLRGKFFLMSMVGKFLGGFYSFSLYRNALPGNRRLWSQWPGAHCTELSVALTPGEGWGHQRSNICLKIPQGPVCYFTCYLFVICSNNDYRYYTEIPQQRKPFFS